MILLSVFWLGCASAGFVALSRFSATPGLASAATDWPPATTIDRPANVFFILIFVHPKCPCSVATLGELDRLMARCHGKLAATVAFIKPDAAGNDWQDNALRKSASGIPDVKTFLDQSGAEAKRFNAATSGQTFLFDPSGRLIFSGGITQSRGHAGDNDGSDAIAQMVLGGQPTTRATPVFGCELFDSIPRITGDKCAR
jgi:hypothetical protein